MNKLVKPVVAAIALASLSGCINLKGPLAVGNEIGTSKVGRACATHSFFSVKGDASIDAAKRNGNITRVSTVDWEIRSRGFVFSDGCVVVRGE